MQFKILFLLMGGFCIATGDGVDEIVKDLEQFLKQGNGNPIDSNHHLTILPNRLGSTDESLVWEALFDDQKVAIKIHKDQSNFEQEVAGYRAVNAMVDRKIESRGIPKIYYTGTIFENQYPVIVMTLFHETLYDRWIKQNRSFSAYSTLEVFRQMATTLSHLRNRGVVHNGIKPDNIFLRDSEVFLGDFDAVVMNGEESSRGTFHFASSRYFRTMDPTPRAYIDDLESLVYTIWYIERINYRDPSGMIISIGRNNKGFVMEKCEHFKQFPRALKAMQFICHHEMLSGRPDPDYDGIVDHLTVAVAEVTRNTRQTKFEWLGSSSSASPVTFAYPGEDRPKGKWNPGWLNERR